MGMTFHTLVWLVPLVFAVHIREEWPEFVVWARNYASPLYSRTDYIKLHGAGLLASVLGTTIIYVFPNPSTTSVFFLLVLAPGLYFNTFFHLGASLLTRTYCPGVITALLPYVPLCITLTSFAIREELLTIRSAVV